MRFLELRNHYMTKFGWDRRVATLAARLTLGIDTVEGIESCVGFNGDPLLFRGEYHEIKRLLN